MRVRSFRSSNDALNRLHENVVWSQLDNFVSVPTDCPQRDERLGWTGDAQAFAPTGSTLFDVQSFWMSWLRDLDLEQTDAGGVPSVVPDVLGDITSGDEDNEFAQPGRAGWADAATIVPWAVYESYGSDEALERQLPSMRRWVDHLERRAAGGLLPTEFQFGDWLDPDAPGDEPWRAKVSGDFVANAFFVRSAVLLARAESITGDVAEVERRMDLAERVRALTWAQWADHAVLSQTGCAIALQFEIAPETERADVARRLAALVRSEAGRISTGFLGTPLILHALAESGHVDEAYLMLLRREMPSWLYQVDRGATTVWERWDAILPDGGIHAGEMSGDDDASMLSFNHYAYGAVIDWVYRWVAGLVPIEPGYRVAGIRPRPSVDVRSAEASIETEYGRLAIDWRLEDDALELEIDVPEGMTARLDLPVTVDSTISGDAIAPNAELSPGAHRIRVTAPLVAAGGN